MEDQTAVEHERFYRTLYKIQTSSDDGWQDEPDQWYANKIRAEQALAKFIATTGCDPQNARIEQDIDEDDRRYVVLANKNHAHRNILYADWTIVNVQWELHHARWIADNLGATYGNQIMIIDTETQRVIPIHD